MGILQTATVLVVFVCFILGAEIAIVMQSEPQTEEDISPHMIEAGEKLYGNPCISKKTCGDCMGAHPDCAWCASQDMDYTAGGKKRCNYANIIKDECGAHDMVNISNTYEFIPGHGNILYVRPNSAYEYIFYQETADRDYSWIKFTVHEAPENVQIMYLISCSEDEPFVSKNTCRDVKKGDLVQAKFWINFISCPENHNKEEYPIWMILEFDIANTEGIPHLILDYRLHMICECDCEKPRNEERNSPKCSGRGTYHCGVCSCYGNRYGKECQCEGKATGDNDDDDKACIAPGDTRICSGRGRCRCGICECFDKTSVTGRFCECDTYPCPRSEDGEICGGEDRGKCVCGKCECTEKWTGPACDCTKDINACRSPYNGEICHGFGECKCGLCQCFDKDGTLRTGGFCEYCQTCPLHCEKYKSCLLCLEYMP